MRGDGPYMAEGLYHVIFNRMNGDRQLFCYLFIGMAMHAAKKEDFFSYRGKGAGKGMEVIVLLERCAGLSLDVFNSPGGCFGSAVAGSRRRRARTRRAVTTSSRSRSTCRPS